MSWALFIVLAVVTLGGGLAVVASRNVVHAALALLVSLVAVAGVYLVLYAEFLALVQVLIYGGAIVIVLVFAIMLTRSAEYPRTSDNRQWPLAALAALGLLGVLVTFFLAIILGTVSGYYSGAVDTLIQRVIEVIVSVPTLPLWMVLTVAIPLNWPLERVFFAITLILALLSWPGLARTVRGKVLALREADYAIAAQLDNGSTSRVMFAHVIPGVMSHLIASLTLSIPGMILGETALSFLGLGLHEPVISWGVMLQDAQQLRTILFAPWLLWPVAAVVFFILAFNFMGDGLRDAADPYKS